MSKGPGHVERTIAAAFKANPGNVYSVEELAKLAYPDALGVEDKHRVAVRRAAKPIAEGMGWHAVRSGHQVVFRRERAPVAAAAASPEPEREWTNADQRAHAAAQPVKETYRELLAVLDSMGAKKSIAHWNPGGITHTATILRRKLIQAGINLNT